MYFFRLIAFFLYAWTASLGASSIDAQLPVQAATPTPNTVYQAGTNAYAIKVTTPKQIGVGTAGNLTVSVIPFPAYFQPVTLACTNLPAETSCIFGPKGAETIPAGGGTITMLLQTAAPHDCGSSTPYFYGNSASLLYVGPVFAGVLLLWLPRRRRMRSLLALLGVCATLGLQGCGHCTDLGTKPDTYTFVLSGTAQGTVALALGDIVTLPITVDIGY